MAEELVLDYTYASLFLMIIIQTEPNIIKNYSEINQIFTNMYLQVFNCKQMNNA
jgi:hypothetical protein